MAQRKLIAESKQRAYFGSDIVNYLGLETTSNNAGDNSPLSNLEDEFLRGSAEEFPPELRNQLE
eukprot:CAMPEP_0170482194 /NCGR_PEP_ID=MMETSP0208-20121228/2321_1 /TAXON_ID=197538 /ORGANISM="Strombidium inclinatum, Strain S3" /LENGTH=63 /DNA_ID=CAMNT_0010755005 /DNA_START=956 /DNA_END=1147 /DNA_ORIENTATION=+